VLARLGTQGIEFDVVPTGEQRVFRMQEQGGLGVLYLAFRGARQMGCPLVPYLRKMTPDNHFILNRHPEIPEPTYACEFCGRGFKFGPVIGEAFRSPGV